MTIAANNDSIDVLFELLRDPLTASFAVNEITLLLTSKPKTNIIPSTSPPPAAAAAVDDTATATTSQEMVGSVDSDEKNIEVLCKRYISFIGSFTGNEDEETFSVLVSFLRGIGEVCLTAPWRKELFSRMGLFPVLMTLLTLQTPRHPERKASIVDECLGIIYYFDVAVFESTIGYDQLKVVLFSFIDYLDQVRTVDRLFENGVKTKRKENWETLTVRYPKFLHIACELIPHMHNEEAINNVLSRLKGLLGFLPNVAMCCGAGAFDIVLDTIESLYHDGKKTVSDEKDEKEKKDVIVVKEVVEDEEEKDEKEEKDKVIETNEEEENKDDTEENKEDDKSTNPEDDEKQSDVENDKNEKEEEEKKEEEKQIEPNVKEDEKQAIKLRDINIEEVVSKLADVAQIIGSYSLQAGELSHLFRLISLSVTSPEYIERGYRRTHFPYLVRCLHSIASANVGGPSAYFVFNGTTSRIIFPRMEKWPFLKGFTFCAWIRIETSENNNSAIATDVATRPDSGSRHLCYFIDDGELGEENVYDIYISSNDQLNIETTYFGNKDVYACSPNMQLPRGKWFFLTMTIAPSAVIPMTGEVKTFINGAQISKVSIRYPKLDSVKFGAIGCRLINAPLDVGFSGQFGAIHLFDDTLSSTQIEDIYINGANYTGSFTNLE